MKRNIIDCTKVPRNYVEPLVTISTNVKNKEQRKKGSMLQRKAQRPLSPDQLAANKESKRLQRQWYLDNIL